MHPDVQAQLRYGAPLLPPRPIRAPEEEIVIPLADRWLPLGEVERQMREQGINRMTLPGMLSREQVAAYKRLRDSHYFLVRNRGAERWKCADLRGHNCHGVHEFFSWLGVDRPFRGLEGALYGYSQISKDKQLGKKILDWAPQMDSGHPYLANQLRPQEPGTDLIAIAIGVLEPISKIRAEGLARRINSLARTPEHRIVL